METKTCIRKQMLALRNQLPETERFEKSRQITQKLRGLKEYQSADTILGFVGYGSEVDTISFLEQAVEEGKEVYCPVSKEDGTMEFYRFTSKAELVEGYKKIPEPSRQAEKFKAEKSEVENCIITGLKSASDNDESTNKKIEHDKEKVFMLMPGVAFDKKKHRIGYGKGFYDRYLSTFVPDFLIAVCFECQILDEIPTQEHDFIPHKVITEGQEY